jgi:hypothetical protein
MTTEETLPSHPGSGRIIFPILWMSFGALLTLFVFAFFNSRTTSPAERPNWSDAPLEEVKGVDYFHQAVILDGHRWINCNFASATLYYDGSASTELVNCKADSATVLTSHSKSVALAIELMNGLQKMASPAQPNGSVSPTAPGRHRSKTPHH